MAAVKKTTKKKTNSSLFSQKFNLKNPKQGFFFFMLIFAMLGGGFYVYQSYAATKYPKQPGWIKVSMTGEATAKGKVKNVSFYKPLNYSKGKFTKDGKYDVYGNSVNDGNDFDIAFNRYVNFPNRMNRDLRVCVSARDVRAYGVKAEITVYMHAKNYKIVPKPATGGGKGGMTPEETRRSTYKIAKPSTKYKEVCSEWHHLKDVRSAYFSALTVNKGAAFVKDVKFEWDR